MVYNQINVGAQGVSISTKADAEEGKIIAFLIGLGIFILTIAISKSISSSKAKAKLLSS
ncbi:hypothetical protein [Emticicia sp. C21]|uniref:hypothetical protein n=1 Tax=Emticicia sp. C21 TaxID=2302915 RepID=UPI001314D31B|nr:hypothetical protein [Emticicia sp. C21]